MRSEVWERTRCKFRDKGEDDFQKVHSRSISQGPAGKSLSAGGGQGRNQTGAGACEPPEMTRI